jgi:DegV family protein with EDD domain
MIHSLYLYLVQILKKGGKVMGNSHAIITTDSTCDLPIGFVEKHQLPVICFTFTMDDEDYKGDLGKTFDFEKFYDAMRRGSMPTTSQINPQELVAFFEPYLKEGKDVIHIAFASKMSSTFDSVLLAKAELEARYPGRCVHAVDTQSASIGQGLLVYNAVCMQEAGASDDEILAMLQKSISTMHHWLMVDSLQHLARGGRLSGTAAMIGSILNIKPIIKVDKGGQVLNIDKAKGTRKGIEYLVDRFREYADHPEDKVIAIAHGDNLEDAYYLKECVLKEFKVKDIIFTFIGPIIGTHTGPGTVGIFFPGNQER